MIRILLMNLHEKYLKVDQMFVANVDAALEDEFVLLFVYC